MRAAFFDMDHTVLTIDTGMSWMKFLRSRGELPLLEMARALYWSALYKAAILDLEALATRLTRQLEGDLEVEMRVKTRQWFDTCVGPKVAARAARAIERHRAAGEMVVLLTGSTQFPAEALGERLDLDHALSTRVEVVEGRFTGRLERMCFGHHKVTTAEAFAENHGIDLEASVFYSDSYNDKPMLERVGEAVAVNPDARLYGHALRRGWRIERWA